MTIASDILDFLWVFLPVALLTHLAFKVGVAQGRSRGGISLFVGCSIVASAFLFRVYFDIVFGRTDPFRIFILTFASAIGLFVAFIGTIRIFGFFLLSQQDEGKPATSEFRIRVIVALAYAAVVVICLMLSGGPFYLRLGAVCYLVDQVLLFGMVSLIAAIFAISGRPSSSARTRLVKVLSAYYLVGPLIGLGVVSLRRDFLIPEFSRLVANAGGAVISSIVAILLLRFIRFYPPLRLRQIRSSYLDVLRENVLRDLYIIGGGITIFVFAVLLVAESFYEDLRISSLKSYAESRLSVTRLTTARMKSSFQEVASKLLHGLESGDIKLDLSDLRSGNKFIEMAGVAETDGQIAFLTGKDSAISGSQLKSLLDEGLVTQRDQDIVLNVVGHGTSDPEFFMLARGNNGTRTTRCDFAVINLKADLMKDFPENRSRLIAPDFRIAYSSDEREKGLNFQMKILGESNFDVAEFGRKLDLLGRSGFEGYEILKGEDVAGAGQYYVLISSPLEFQGEKWILMSLEREDRIPQLFQPTESLLVLAGLLILGLFSGGLVTLSVSFRWSLTLEREVQKKIQELRSSEDKYRRIVENPYFGSFIMVDGRIIFSTNRLAGIFETGVDQLAGGDLSSFIDSENLRSLRIVFDAIIAGEKSGDKWEVEGKTASGRRVSLSGYSSIINIGNKRGVQSLVVDSTNELREKEKMEQFEKLESMATLAAGIAHDYNNILQVVLGSSQLLQHKLSDLSLKKYADNITNVAIRGSDLSKRLLTFSRRKGPEERQVFDLNSIIVESLQVFGETFPRTIKIETQLCLEPVYVEGDQSQIQQVIFNLAVNARDAMPHGGTLTLRTEIRETSSVEAEIYQVNPGKYAFTMVKDNGQGIPPELMTKVFEPFFTTKEPGKGTGLGLSVVYGIVRSHKGFLKVYSELKRGTVFNIFLPLAGKKEEKASPPKCVKEVSAPSGEKILFMDDEEGIREAAQFLLQQAGYTVVTAKDGVEGIEIYKKDWAEVGLVVLDLNMPELSGREVLDSLFILNPGVRVLISTGYITPEERDGLKGVVEVIEKPFDFDQLIEKVRIALR
jgi:PAS domain S-box-containing protein